MLPSTPFPSTKYYLISDTPLQLEPCFELFFFLFIYIALSIASINTIMLMQPLGL